MSSKRPHLVIVNPDQWRGDVLGHLGNPAAVTPTLDGLVDTGAVSFANAFCQNPVCTPSRCSFMTGWYPHVRGHRTMHHMLRPDEPMLLRTLKQKGYHVWWGGKNDVVPAQHGFDAYCDVKTWSDNPTEPYWSPGRDKSWRGDSEADTFYSFFAGQLPHSAGHDHYHDGDWGMIEAAIDHIRHAPRDRPLCLFLAMLYPHPPYAVEAPWYDAIARDRLPPRVRPPDGWRGKPAVMSALAQRLRMDGWTDTRWDELRAVYYGMCARVDHQIGLLLDALRRADLYDDTAVMVFSDHGDYAGDFGLVEKTQNTFEDCLTRVPLIIKPPAGTPCRSGVRDALVELIDIPATVEALTGIAPAHTHFGRSLLPLVAGERDHHRDAIFCEGGRREDEPHCMERESEIGPDDLYWPRVGLQTQIPEHGKGIMCRTAEHKYVRRLYESDELYDLVRDPAETDNRIDDPAYAATAAALRERLLDFMVATGDVVPWETDKR